MRFLNQVFKSRQIGFPKITRVDVFGIETMAVPFRTGMYGIVLGAGMQLVIFFPLRTLQTAYRCHTHLAGEVRVFSVSFLPPSPTRITEDVDVRCPHGEPLITLQSAFFAEFGILGACFIRNCGEYIVKQFIVERSSHTDGLREYGCQSGASYAVQRFVPPVIGFYAQSGNGGRCVLHQGGFLFQCEPAYQIIGTLFRA